ncbi:TPA: hypothetical protein ACOENQ_003317 [Stenotrophomonas maltophilia]
MSGGIIVVALFPMTQLSDMTDRGNWHSIRDMFPPLPDRTHAGTEHLRPFQVGDKVWAWYKDQPRVDYGQPVSGATTPTGVDAFRCLPSRA